MKIFRILVTAMVVTADLIGFNRLGNNVYNKYMTTLGKPTKYQLEVLTFLAKSSNEKIATMANKEKLKFVKPSASLRRLYRSRLFFHH